MSKELNIRGDQRQMRQLATTDPQWPLGTRMYLKGGRVFRYAKNGSTALAAARVMQGPRHPFWARDLVPNAHHAVGATSITVVNQATYQIDKDFYKGAVLYVNNGQGEGYLYDVAASALVDLNATTMTFFLDESLVTTLTTGSRLTLLQHRYRGVDLARAPATTQVVGVTPRTVGADQYFWLQTGGPAPVLQDGELRPNLRVSASQDTEGAVQPSVVVIPHADFRAGTPDENSAEGLLRVRTHDADFVGTRNRFAPFTGTAVHPETNIGWCLDAVEDTEHCLVWLELD
jgi:hypothetical protein